MSRDPFSLLADTTRSARGTARRTLAEHTGGILLLGCLLLTATLPLVILRPVNPFSEEFFLRTAYTVLTSTLSYILFVPEGVRAERGRNPAITEGAARLLSLSSLVRGGHLAAFSDFCTRLAEKEYEQAREGLLALPAGGPREERRRARRLRRLRVRAVSPALVLCGDGERAISDVGRPAHRAARGAVLRPLSMLLCSLLLSSVAVLPGGTPDAATAVRILSGLFSVLTAAFAGYGAGVESALGELSRTERRILFLSSFCESEGLSPEGAAPACAASGGVLLSF